MYTIECENLGFNCAPLHVSCEECPGQHYVIRAGIIQGVKIGNVGIELIAKFGTSTDNYFYDELGKIVFLTRKEAEKALEERGGANETK